ncbi:MAG TPA: hypothetical protein VGC30_15155, partial [Dokdonella sp.]
QVLVFNKIDLLASEARDGDARERGDDGLAPAASGDVVEARRARVRVSALDRSGIDALFATIARSLGAERVQAELHLPVEAGRLRARLHEQGLVAEEHADDDGWRIRIDAPLARVEPLFGLPSGDGDWLRDRLLAAIGRRTYNSSATPH